MRLATSLLSTLLLLAAAVTAALKLVGHPEVIDTLATVGVTGGSVTVLGLIELTGAAGLAIGWIARPRLAVAAAGGLTLLFLGAVAAHLRVGDHEVAAPLVLAVLAATVTWLHRGRVDARPTVGASDAPQRP